MDSNDIIIGLGTVVVLGVGMQWLARRLQLPAILLLIAAGLVVGPWLDLVDPDEIFGDALFPVVSLAVGLLLFEGGLGLDIAELRTSGAKPVVRLITIGVVITGVALALVAMPLFDLPLSQAALLGALLVVSGPTVVGPLLKLSRPRAPSSTILRWEGIMIDPIGATLALIVLEVILNEGSPGERLLGTAGVGIAFGILGSILLVGALRKFLVPDDLELAVTFMIVVGAYAGAEAVQSESGLFATTALGVVLANQRFIQVRRITAFNEDIGIILLGGLFILLSARVDVDQLVDVIVPSIALVAVAVLVVRPVVTWVCTVGSGMKWADRAFVGWMSPRGIVAAATSALVQPQAGRIRSGRRADRRHRLPGDRRDVSRVRAQRPTGGATAGRAAPGTDRPAPGRGRALAPGAGRSPHRARGSRSRSWPAAATTWRSAATRGGCSPHRSCRHASTWPSRASARR